VLPDSRVDNVWRSPADNPSTPAGAVLLVDFTLAGQRFTGINGGPQFAFTEAISFVIDCDDQAEVDRLWNALTDSGGSAGQCGWLKDRYGMSWQVIPRQMGEMLGDPDRSGPTYHGGNADHEQDRRRRAASGVRWRARMSVRFVPGSWLWRVWPFRWSRPASSFGHSSQCGWRSSR